MITADPLAPVKGTQFCRQFRLSLPVGAAVLGASLAVRFCGINAQEILLIKSTRKGAFLIRSKMKKLLKKIAVCFVL